jgi:hypothetical protein
MLVGMGVDAMDNMYFISGKLKTRYIRIKINKLSKVILVLWLMCISFYIVYVYLNYKISYNEKQTNNRIKENQMVLQNENNKFTKKLETIETLEKLLDERNIDLIAENIIITDNKMDLSIKVNSDVEYINFIKAIEASGKYKILNLSTILSNDQLLSFKIALEVNI